LAAHAQVELHDIWPMIQDLRVSAADMRNLRRAAGQICPLPPDLENQCEVTIAKLDGLAERLHQKHYEARFSQNGGFRRVANTTPRHELYTAVIKSMPRWLLAGERLYITAQLALHHATQLEQRGGAGLKKASFVIEDRSSFNRAQIDVAWRDFR